MKLIKKSGKKTHDLNLTTNDASNPACSQSMVSEVKIEDEHPSDAD